MTEEIENTDSTNGETPDETEDNQDANKEMEEKNRQLFERAKKAEAEAKELREKLKTAKPEQNIEKQPDDFGLLQKSYLRSAGVTAEDEVELARDIQKKTNMDWDELVDDDYFKTKLEKLREAKSNELATSKVRGSAGQQSAKDTPEYWLSKGTPPNAEQVPDRKMRAKIARAFLSNAKSGKQFYNE